MFNTIEGLSGPDFLDAVADAELGNGNAVNADIYRLRSREWAQDRARIERLEAELSAAAVSRRSALPHHAITPTDQRRAGA
jgi:hypothetical protein